MAELPHPAATPVHRDEVTEECVRMTVSYTVEQYEWLRRQAFEQRTSLAAELRRCVNEAREQGEDNQRGSRLATSPAQTSRLRHRAEQAVSTTWVRLSLSFTPEQHEWLWARAFEERTTVASLVRRYVGDIREQVSGGGADAPLSLARGVREWRPRRA